MPNNHPTGQNTLDQPRTALIVGCGDIGRRLGRRLVAEGIATTGLVRQRGAGPGLDDAGIEAFFHDLDFPPPRHAPDADWLFWCAPPPGEGETDPRIARWLAAASPPRCMVYVSTTGVYAPPFQAGDWLTEAHPLLPVTVRGRRRRHAERTVLAYVPHAVIARVPGIYATDRLPEARLRQGLPLPLRAECPLTNRVQADDLVDALLACAGRGAPGQAYNITDGRPSPMTDYFLAAARVLHLPPPPQIPLGDFLATAGPVMASYLGPTRLLSNRRASEELGWHPRYPDLLAGLGLTDPA